MYIQKALEARLQVITTTATVCITMLDLSLQNNLGKKKDLKITKYLKDHYILQRQEARNKHILILRVNHYHSVLSLLARSVGNILLGKENVNVCVCLLS